VGDINPIVQITQLSQTPPSVQRTGDGNSRKQQEEEKPQKHDEVELTNEVEDEVVPVVEAEDEDPPTESHLDLAV
jgi:hypothetical protein